MATSSKTDKRTASELADELAWFGEEIQKRATNEVREELGAEIVRFGKAKDANDLEVMRETFGEDFQPSADFLAGIRYAGALVADTNFEY